MRPNAQWNKLSPQSDGGKAQNHIVKIAML